MERWQATELHSDSTSLHPDEPLCVSVILQAVRRQAASPPMHVVSRSETRFRPERVQISRRNRRAALPDGTMRRPRWSTQAKNRSAFESPSPYRSPRYFVGSGSASTF